MKRLTDLSVLKWIISLKKESTLDSAEQEAAFLEKSLPEKIQVTRRLFAATLAVIIILQLFEVLGEFSMPILTLRLITFFSIAGTLFCIRKLETPRKFDMIISLWALLFSVNVVILDTLRPAAFFSTFIWNVIEIILIYGVLSFPLRYQAASSAIITFGALLSYIFIRAPHIELSVILSTLMAFLFVNIYGCYMSLHRQISWRRFFISHQEQIEYSKELQNSLDEIQKLRGILPICSVCKKIRNDQGYWDQLEDYMQKHSDITFSHGICPDCIKKEYPKVYKSLKNKQKTSELQ